jgi:predicted metal-binding membrane protein
LIAGLMQFSAWKAEQLKRCCEMPGCGRGIEASVVTAWRYGTRLGLHCSYCCSGLTVGLLAVGIMDLRAMAVVTAAVNAERLGGRRVARAIGAASVGAGFVLIARAARL